MGNLRALLNYLKEGKGRRDALDFLKAGVVMVGVMVLCSLILMLATRQ